MAVVRSETLPLGRYWYVILPDEEDAWNAWTKANSGKVITFATERLDPQSTWGNLLGADGEGSWVAFEATEPVRWNPPFKGFPTIIPKGATVTGTQDVVQAPDPEAPPSVGALVQQLAPWAVITVLGVVALRRLIK